CNSHATGRNSHPKRSHVTAFALAHCASCRRVVRVPFLPASAGGPHNTQGMRNWQRGVVIAILSLSAFVPLLHTDAVYQTRASLQGLPSVSHAAKIPSLGPQQRAPASTRDYIERSEIRRPKLSYARSRSMPILP